MRSNAVVNTTITGWLDHTCLIMSIVLSKIVAKYTYFYRHVKRALYKIVLKRKERILFRCGSLQNTTV